MPYAHSPQQLESILQQSGEAPWLWLLEIEVPSTSTTKGVLRLAANDTPVTWGTFSDGTAKVYSPFPFQLGPVQSDNEGTIETMTIVASNVSREAESALQHFGGLIGEKARLHLVNADELDSVVPYWFAEGDVLNASSNVSAATIEIGQVNVQQYTFPGQRVSRGSCRHRNDYGGLLCGYNTLRVGSLQTCDFSLDGPNGCTVHGDDEVSAGLPRLHPLRWGGFKGVPRKTGLGSN